MSTPLSVGRAFFDQCIHAYQSQKIVSGMIVLLTGLLLVIYKFQFKAPNWVKILLFINSLIINDISLRKYDKKISKVSAFFLLLLQKFKGVFVAKLLISGELPALLRDHTFLFFFCLHLLSFMIFHTPGGTKILLKYKHSPYRKVVQETLKGYGKGYKLFKLIAKGVDMSLNPVFFTMVLVVRGCISALYKSVVLSYLLKKKLKFEKPIENIKFNALPSIAVYLSYICFTNLATVNSVPMVMESSILSFFVPTMIVLRTIKTTWKVSRKQTKKFVLKEELEKKKKLKKALKKKLEKAERGEKEKKEKKDKQEKKELKEKYEKIERRDREDREDREGEQEQKPGDCQLEQTIQKVEVQLPIQYYSEGWSSENEMSKTSSDFTFVTTWQFSLLKLQQTFPNNQVQNAIVQILKLKLLLVMIIIFNHEHIHFTYIQQCNAYESFP